MFGIGGGELIVILLVAVLLIKPENLPKTIRKIGKTLGEIRKLSGSFNRAIRQAEEAAKLNDIKEEVAKLSDIKAESSKESSTDS